MFSRITQHSYSNMESGWTGPNASPKPTFFHSHGELVMINRAHPSPSKTKRRERKGWRQPARRCSFGTAAWLALAIVPWTVQHLESDHYRTSWKTMLESTLKARFLPGRGLSTKSTNDRAFDRILIFELSSR